MQGWILFHRDLDPALPEVPEILRFQEVAARRSLSLHVLKPHNFDLVAGPIADWAVHYEGRDLERPDFILCRTGAETDYFTLAVLRHFERRGVRLINGPEAIYLVADKLHTMQQLIRAGLPVPSTILGKFPMDVDLVEKELGFPVIVKTLRGTRGTGVLKCEDRGQFEDLAGLLASAEAKADFLFQHYVRASHGRDVRVLVIGGRVVAAMHASRGLIELPRTRRLLALPVTLRPLAVHDHDVPDAHQRDLAPHRIVFRLTADAAHRLGWVLSAAASAPATAR